MTAFRSSWLPVRYSGPPPSVSSWLTIATPRARSRLCQAAGQPGQPGRGPGDPVLAERDVRLACGAG